MKQPLAELIITTVNGIVQDFNAHKNAGGGRAIYAGIDYQTLPNTTQSCFAVEDGFVSNHTDDGNYCVLTGATGQWFYVHLSAFNGGNRNVRAGEIVGFCGQSGNTFGPHLHLGLKINGVYVDPQPYLKFNNINMDEFTIIPARINKDIGDCLRRAGISDPGSSGQKQNCANLNKSWLDKNGVVKSHDGTWQNMESKLAVGDIVRVRGIPGTPPFPVAPVTPPTPGTDPDGVKWREYSKLSKELIK